MGVKNITKYSSWKAEEGLFDPVLKIRGALKF